MKVVFYGTVVLALIKFFTFIRFPQTYLELNTYLAIKVDPFCKNLIYFHNEIPLHFKLLSSQHGFGILEDILVWIYAMPGYFYILVLITLFFIDDDKCDFH